MKTWSVGDRVIVPCQMLTADYAVATVTKVMPQTCNIEMTDEDVAVTGRNKTFALPRRPEHGELLPFDLQTWIDIRKLLEAMQEAHEVAQAKRRELRDFVDALRERREEQRAS